MTLQENTYLSLWRGVQRYYWKPGRRTRVEIASEVCDRHRLSITELVSKSRERRIAWPRQEAMYMMRLQGFTLNQIGRYLGGRDHSTVLTGVKRHLERLASVTD